MADFAKDTSVEDLTAEQLELLTASDGSWVVAYLEAKTIFDTNRVRLLLEMGKSEAKRRLSGLQHSSGKDGCE